MQGVTLTPCSPSVCKLGHTDSQTTNSKNRHIFSQHSDDLGQLWLPMCGGLSVVYGQCCNTLGNCGSSDGLCEMFYDGATALLVNLVAAQERMAKK